MTPAEALAQVVAAVEAEGKRLRAEFHAPQGPRGRRGSCPLDREIEERLRDALQALVPARFCGEECAVTEGTREGWVWLVDPHDGTFEYTSGRRGSAVSVALLRHGMPVLAVVHAPDAPDRGADTIAWAEGLGPILRNGRPTRVDLRAKTIAPGELVWATASSAQRPESWSRAVAPGRYVAMPSVA
jgi:fructose-1,6-bisphosphatase/inositol monophosphatase family enzyme